MSNLDLKLRLTADGSGFTGTVRASKDQIDQLNQSMRHASDAGRAGAQGVDEVDKAGRRTRPTVNSLDDSVKNLTKSLAGFVSGALALRELNTARRDAQLFGAAMAEVSTLMDDLSEMDVLAAQASNLTRQFGGLPTDQVKSFYNIYSAGAENAAEATAILQDANRLTIGGVTQLGTAVDGLTSVLNAYQMEGGRAGEVSDAFFVAMRGGKTTVDEIASSIGGVASIASSAGVDLDQLLASVAAITTGGVGTSEAMNQVRQAIVSVIKPTGDAAKLAQELGLEFNSAALRSQGLAGFLDDVRQATDGNLDQMSRLFGSVEALNAVIALTGPQAGTLASLLEDMAEKTGATEAAFDKMSRTLDQQMKQLSGRFAVMRTETGELLGAALLPLIEVFNQHFDLITSTTSVLLGAVAAYGAYRLALIAATAAKVAFNAATAANPLTLAIMVLGAGSVALFNYVRSQREAADTTAALNHQTRILSDSLLTLEQRYKGLSEAQMAARRNQLLDMQASLASEIKLLEEQATGFEIVNIKLDVARDMYAGVTAELDDLTEALRRHREQASQIPDAVARIIGQLEKERDTFGMTSVELARYNVLAAGGTAEQAELAASIAQSTAAMEEQQRATQALEDGVKALINELDPLGAEFEAVYQKQQMLIEAAARGLITPEQRDNFIEQLVAGLTDAAELGGDQAANALADRFSHASERIASGLQNAIISGDWGGIGATVGGALAGGIAGAVSQQVASQFASAAAGAILGPVVGAVAGGLVGLAANAVAKFFRDDWDPTEARQAAQGTGSVLGSINAKSESIAQGVGSIAVGTDQLVGINRDMLIALRGVQAGISGASTLIARGAGGVDFGVRTGSHLSRSQQVGVGMLGAAGLAPSGMALAGVLGQGLDFADRLTLGLFSSIGKALGGKTRQVDEGINILGGSLAEMIDGAVIEAYGTFRTRSNAFSSSRTREQSQRLSSEVERQFQVVFGSIWDSVEAGAVALRMAPADVQRALDAFVIETQRISLEGLDAAAQQAEIEAVFGKIFDDLAGTVVPFLDQFQRAGEGLGETLARVASQSQVTEEAARRLGFQFAELSGVELAAVSDRLTELAGGVGDFVDAMEGFIRNFASEGRQFAIYADDITRALQQQGMALPATRDGYWALMQAQDATTEAGAENIATLLRLQGAADRYYSLLERRQSEALSRQESLINTRLREAQSAARAISQALSGLTAGMPGATSMRRDTALRDLRRMVDAGVVRDGAQLTGALAAATRIDMAEFASFDDYLREVAATGAVLSDLDAITREQVAVEERMLSVLDQQYQLTAEGQEKQIKALENIEHAVVRSAPVVVQAGASGGVGASATQYRELIAEVRSLRQQLDSSQTAIARHTQRSARTLERIEMDG
ncbi:MAG: phage tail tape measure protein, partial [Marinobacter sp.]|nr:phage tail tape measure protein [Marinobacter sp.]